MAQRIILLDEEVANKIAAGEVVERPASIVKELVENSVDAGATRIEVDILEGGKKLVRVTDNGCGMSQEDAVLSIQRFATSKIRCAEDLDEITTLGFRGEALPSIASVSRLRMQTREQGADEGVLLVAEGGEVTDLRTCGCPPGTTLEVHNLFYNTPARLKFLKTSATERGHVADWVGRSALARPDIAFRFTHNNAVSLVSPGQGDLLAVLGAIYGGNAVRQFVPVEHNVGGLRIYGFVSRPTLTRVNRSYEMFFVNGRYVRSRIFSHALTEAYQGILPAGKYAICAVHIVSDPRLVDPNVHPTKTEVRFTREWEVHNVLREAVREALAGQDLVPRIPASAKGVRQPMAGGDRVTMHGVTSELEFEPFRQELRRRAGISPKNAATATPAVPVQEAAGLAGRELRPLGQLAKTYIVAEAEGELVLINQHRAAERVIYQRLVAAEQRRAPESQMLVVPVTLELTAREAAAVEQHLESFAALGFHLEPFGQHTFLLSGIPLVLVGTSYEEAVRELIADLAEGRIPEGLGGPHEEFLAMVACKAALKAGQALSPAEISQLLEDLAQTEMPDRCPHGSAIALSVSLEELDRKIQR